MIAIAWNPVIGIAEAVAIALIVLAAGSWLAWLGSSGVRPGMRASLVVLRAIALAALAVLWLNPGRWKRDDENQRKEWVFLADRSASMGVEESDGKSRWKTAGEVAAKLRPAEESGDVLRLRPFSGQVEADVAALSELQPDGGATDLGRAVTSVLDQPAGLAGIVVMSDGRQASRWSVEEIGRRARGRGVPIHVIPVGANWGGKDLNVQAVQRRVTAFKGQTIKLSFAIENRGLGSIKPTVIVNGPDGKEIGRKVVAIEDKEARKIVAFEFPATGGTAGEYIAQIEPWHGEQIQNNNRATVRVDIAESKTRVLLLEGAPYWDSKFLAQLLRQQGAVEILTVHRLNEERYFRVEASGAEPLQSPDTVFPSSAEELRRYDLIVFGKGADGFVDGTRASALQGFVRDQGGAILFARGKPYRGRHAPLEGLESVEWGERFGSTVRFLPLADAGGGLFGGLLPGASDQVWPALPPLEGAHGIVKLKPFARVLAEGGVDGRETRVPLLIARRYGRGMIATVNADGLWRWDFGAEQKEHAAVYQDFWVQLMQWCATYSDFRPGQDYAVRLRETATEPGQPVRAVIAYRGTGQSQPRPVVKILRGNEVIGSAATTPLPDGDGMREWAGVITMPEAGRYTVAVADEAKPGKLEGQVDLVVNAQPTERDDFRPDLELLASLARESGGRMWSLDEVDALRPRIAGGLEAPLQGKATWESLWSVWWVALLVVGLFGAEWWLRRREGLW